MTDLVETRVVELCPGEWVAQFLDGRGWVNLGDGFFVTEAEAMAFLDGQIAGADLNA